MQAMPRPTETFLPPPPRALRRRPGRRGLLGRVPLVVWVLGLLGVGLLLAALWLLASLWFIRVFGAAVPGKVTGLVPPPASGMPARVQFTFHIGTQEYAGEDAVDDKAFSRLYEGVDVKVKVLRAWPGSARLFEPAGQSSGYGGCLAFLAVTWNAALAVVLWSCLRRPLAQRRLVREGVAAAGYLLQKEDGSGWPRTWHVHYRYQAPCHGRRAHGQDGGGAALREWEVLMQVGKQDFEAAQAGTPVTVLYDPRQPSRSLVYAFADYEAVPVQSVSS
jgi:hypothetical protein